MEHYGTQNLEIDRLNLKVSAPPSGCGCFHYVNISVQYTAIFHGCKKDNFQMKNYDVFLIFAQNNDCGYTLEPPQ